MVDLKPVEDAAKTAAVGWLKTNVKPLAIGAGTMGIIWAIVHFFL